MKTIYRGAFFLLLAATASAQVGSPLPSTTFTRGFLRSTNGISAAIALGFSTNATVATNVTVTNLTAVSVTNFDGSIDNATGMTAEMTAATAALANAITFPPRPTRTNDSLVYFPMGESGYRYYTTPRDDSGNDIEFNNYITVQPSLASNSPPTGSSIYFHFGSTAYISGWNTFYNAQATNIGVEAFVRMNELTNGSNNGQLFGTDAYATAGLSLVFDQTKGGFVAKVKGNYGATNYVQIGDAVMPSNTNNWWHLAVVLTNGTATFYTNGVACGSSRASTTTTLATAYWNNMGSTDPGLVYDLDEFRMFTCGNGSNWSSTNLMAFTNFVRFTGYPRTLGQQRTNDVQFHTGQMIQLDCAVWPRTNLVWYRDGVAVSTNTQLTVTNCSKADAGYYWAVASGVVSESVKVSVVDLIEPYQADGISPIQAGILSRNPEMFIHYGMGTFTNWDTGGFNSDWSAAYSPTNIDTEQWAETARIGGFKAVVLTVKHHTGFCLWDSAYTTFDVGSKTGYATNDVVRKMADSCASHGLKFGVYYSLLDWHEKRYQTNFPAYVDFVKGQLTELLTRYGPICEVWFDGQHFEGRNNAAWRIPELYDLVHRLQPDCAVIINATIGTAANPDWSYLLPYTNGNPVVYWPSDARAADASELTVDQKLYADYFRPGSRYYMPFQTALSFDTANQWFAFPTNTLVSRTAIAMHTAYTNSLAMTNPCIFNVPPGTDGTISTDFYTNVIRFGSLAGLIPAAIPAKTNEYFLRIPADNLGTGGTVFGGDVMGVSEIGGYVLTANQAAWKGGPIWYLNTEFTDSANVVKLITRWLNTNSASEIIGIRQICRVTDPTVYTNLALPYYDLQFTNAPGAISTYTNSIWTNTSRIVGQKVSVTVTFNAQITNASAYALVGAKLIKQ